MQGLTIQSGVYPRLVNLMKLFVYNLASPNKFEFKDLLKSLSSKPYLPSTIFIK